MAECFDLFGSTYPAGCTPAEAKPTAPPTQITPQQGLDYLGQGLGIFFQTLTGVMRIKAIDDQGNFVAENGQTIPGNTPVVVTPPVEEDEWYENPGVIVGGLAVALLLGFLAFRG